MLIAICIIVFLACCLFCYLAGYGDGMHRNDRVTWNRATLS